MTSGALWCAMVLGGNAGNGYIGDALLQFILLPLFLLIASWSLADRRQWPYLLALLAVVAVPLMQLLPLPPVLWTRLPNRSVFVDGFGTSGASLPWLPISVTPHETWLGALSLIVPSTIFLGTTQLGYRSRRTVCMAFVVLAAAAAFVGMLQVAQGPTSPLRFYAETNLSEAVGFFANRNHFASLLYVALVFTTAFAIDGAMALISVKRRHRTGSAVLVVIAAFGTVLVLVAAQAMARSRSGIGLTLLALLGAFLLVLRDQRTEAVRNTVRLLAVVVGLTLVFVAQIGVFRLLERFAVDPFTDSTRATFRATTLEAAVAYLPFGSGIGSFVPVYAQFEKARDLLDGAYVNQAHNDVLQALLEGGIAGIIVAAALMLILATRTYRLWWSAPIGRLEIDRMLARAATLAIILMGLHAFFDYGLRTGALMATFAFSAGLLFAPPQSTDPEPTDDMSAVAAPSTTSGHKSRRSRAQRDVPASAQWTGPMAGPLTGAAPPLQWTHDPSLPPPPSATAEPVNWPKEWGPNPTGSAADSDGPASDGRPAEAGKRRPAIGPGTPIVWPATEDKEKDGPKG